ncbi:MAG: hypothetical protein KJ063_08735 [Anaerolineae bacterium]|nr:hypothetical protein [Anaerolineae bacterium]
MAHYNFEFLNQITAIEVIARGEGVRARHYLNRCYGRGRWRKMKGRAIIRYEDGEIWLAEIHWFEAEGIGQRDHKAVHHLERIE